MLPEMNESHRPSSEPNAPRDASPPADSPLEGVNGHDPSSLATGAAAESLPERLAREPLPRQRRVVLPIMLFIATCFSTFYVGATNWMPLAFLDNPVAMRIQLGSNFLQGLTYMGAVLAILLTHEMGHFVTTLIYRIPSSFPYCIPVPVNAIGTMGAVIGMDGLKANRREMFDLGLSGPLAGLVVAVPVLWVGILQLDLSQPGYGLGFYNPLLIQIMIEWLRPDLGAVEVVRTSQLNAFFMAGWVGLLITGLNMMPISQLDGGHVIYALFRRRAHTIARLFLIGAIVFIVAEEVYFWIVMLTLVILIGTDHPPTSDDHVPIGPVRWGIGIASLVIPVLCFPPYGFVM